jgi:hypothetical protein
VHIMKGRRQPGKEFISSQKRTFKEAEMER